ncbi:lysM domain receptor-like kinase 4 [Silene latifolia]|uniref:lysM domain receptor-like kinase 4 n=1 Tax=Silene latifolia TaxID=37657 RepID=UPI003D7848BB
MNGELAAIKKTKADMSKEVNSLAKVSHFNIIQVLGVCFNEGYWYLIYEYASNGPLSDWIFSNNSNVKFLSWTQRVQVVLDVARGLNYIHSYNSPPYVWKDVKSSNILLDSNFRAKIGNFSPVKSAEGQKSPVTLEKVYLSPEYRDKGHVSPKLDVYGFGILMLEVLTGKKADGNISEMLLGEKESLRRLIDPNLKENYPEETAVSVARLIEICLNGDPSSRPDMEEVVKSLAKVLNTSMTWESSI